MDSAHRGEAALNAKEWPKAIELYTAAITDSPTSPLYHIHRSTAYQKSRQYELAIIDAEKAVVLAKSRAKRELIAQAQLRRAVPLFFLHRYGDARACLEWSKKLNDKEKMVGVWQSQVDGKVKKLDEGDDALRVTVLEIPEVTIEKPSPKANGGTKGPATNGKPTTQTNGAAEDAATTAPAKPAAPTQTPKEKIRHDWYQNNDFIVFTLLAKGVLKELAVIEIESLSLNISFPLTTGSQFDFSLDPLYAPIDPTKSSYRVLSTKIEVSLKKVELGRKWHALESSEPVGETTTTNGGSDDAVKQAVLADAQPSGPAYPTSSRTGPKNWDKILEKKPKPKSKDAKDKRKASDANDDAGDDPSDSNEEPEKVDDDDQAYDSDEEGGGDPNFFFKKLYAGASDDVKKAMMKSYQESGGTALSTNWEDVKKARVPVEPPEGMEAHEWEGARSKGKGL